MRYNDDVINAERWNTDLKKSLLPANPDSDENADHQDKTIHNKIISSSVNLSAPPDARETNHTPEAGPMKTGPSEKPELPPVTDDRTADENLQVSNPELIRFPETNTSTINMRPSGNRINRRKKRGRFLLSGLLTGLFYRSPNVK